jgi:Lar family restriction alleviation protein
MKDLLPCPFCGSENINLHQGSSFRWVYMGCDDCGAQTGEYRFHTLVEQEQGKIEALQDGVKEWNTRVTPQADSGDLIGYWVKEPSTNLHYFSYVKPNNDNFKYVEVFIPAAPK